MNIEAPNNIKTRNEIFPGEVFISEGEFFLKTEEACDSDGNYINAVQLSNGELCYFEDDAKFLFVCPHCTLKVD